MEKLQAQIGSQIDLNQIANTLINHVTERISQNVLSNVKLLLENHFPIAKEKTEFLSQKEAYERLGLSRSSFYQREKKGFIKRDGSNGRPLYSRDQIENYLKSIDNNPKDYNSIESLIN